ncbi:MAG: hypothetical protein Q8L23_10960 [Caulobacter sp.]|nr:hypothetical protein [Caulobacter sp.]
MPTHSSLLLFPANRLRVLTRIAGETDAPLDGRWTVNGWLNEAPDQVDGD